jgi:NTE family protein
MNVQAKPSVGGARRLLPFERLAFVLQGGGAPGAYQAGVYEALAESRMEPDWLSISPPDRTDRNYSASPME